MIALCNDPFSEPVKVSSSKMNPSLSVLPASIVVVSLSVISLLPALSKLVSSLSSNKRLSPSFDPLESVWFKAR